MRNFINGIIFILCLSFTAHLVMGQTYRRIDHVEGQAISENFVKNSGAVKGTRGWFTFDDGAVTIPVNGIGGSPFVTIVKDTLDILRGNSYFECKITATNDTQGQGCSYDFRITQAAARNGKALKVSFDYATGAAAWPSGSLGVWIYNVTDATISGKVGDILPCLSSSTCAPFEGIWYPDYSRIDYRLIIMRTITDTTIWNLQFDDVKVFEQQGSFGNVTTGWEDVSSLVTADCSLNNTQTAFRRRVGENTEYSVRWEFAGSTTASTCGFNFPEIIDTGGPQIDNDVNQIMGWGITDDNGGSKYAVTVRTDSGDTSRVLLRDYSASGSEVVEGSSVSNTSPYTIGSGDSVRFNFRFKTVGFQPQVIMSDVASTQDVSEIMSLNTGSHTSTGNFQDVPLNTIVNSSHGGSDTAGNEVDILIAGLYTIIGNIGWPVDNTGNRGCQIRIDHAAGGSTDIVSNIHSTISTDGPKSPCSITGYPLEFGDTVTLEGFQTSGGNLTYDTQDKSTFLSVSSFKGGQTIALSESATYGVEGSRPRLASALVEETGAACTVTSQQGAWLTTPGTRNGPGDCSWVINTGIFSETPFCQVTPFSGAGDATGQVNSATSPTATSIRTQRGDNGGDAVGSLYITCVGTR